MQATEEANNGNAAEDAESEEEHETLLASCELAIMGCQYYGGVVHVGEHVNLVREPNNVYDGNAIRVDNMEGAQVASPLAIQLHSKQQDMES